MFWWVCVLLIYGNYSGLPSCTCIQIGPHLVRCVKGFSFMLHIGFYSPTKMTSHMCMLSKHLFVGWMFHHIHPIPNGTRSLVSQAFSCFSRRHQLQLASHELGPVADSSWPTSVRWEVGDRPDHWTWKWTGVDYGISVVNFHYSALLCSYYFS